MKTNVGLQTPFLILGYERSGTTLLRRLVSMHPGLEFDLVHEMWEKLHRSRTREKAIERLSGRSKQAGQYTGGAYSITAGLKRPYGGLKSVQKTVSKMFTLFPTTRIIHILRDPEAAISSQMRRGRKFEPCLKAYRTNVPDVMGYLVHERQTLFLSFEQLTAEPRKTLQRIYTWMGEPAKEDHLTEVLSNKDPWLASNSGTPAKYVKPRWMPGLRYFDKITASPHKSVLSSAQQELVSQMKLEIDWNSFNLMSQLVI